MGQQWSGYSSLINVNELTEYVRHQAQELQGFAQLAAAPTGKALGLNKGDTVQHTYYGNISAAGGELDENEPIPEGSVTPIKATYTIKEYGNSIRFTGKLEDFARLSVEDDFIQALVDDLRKLENKLVYDEAKLTSWVANFNSGGDGFATNGTPVSAQNEEFSLANLRFLRKQARSRLIPPFDGESYVVVTGVNAMDALCFDSAVSTMLQYDSGRAALNGEIGRVAGCRLVEDNHKITTTTGSYEEVLLFGADAVIDEVAMPWELRDEVKDHGRHKSIAYLGYKGVKKILSQSTHSKEHVIKTGSA